MKVKCIRTSDRPDVSITVGKEYTVIEDDERMVTVIDDSGNEGAAGVECFRQISEGFPAKDTIMHDHQASNPKLHLLYIKWAVKHLTYIDAVIKQFGNFSNFNMHGCIEALQGEYCLSSCR